MSRKKQVYEKITALYCRISLDDGGDNESMSMIQSLFAQLVWLMQLIKLLIWLLKMWLESTFTP